jgi:hypothetical protein
VLLDGAGAVALLRRAERAPHLAFTSTDVPALAEQIRGSVFPTVAGPVRCFFLGGPYLGRVVHRGTGGEIAIFIHDLLNRTETPEAVFRHIIVHELIHLVVPGREVKGKLKEHPPEFWEAERRLSPHSAEVWSWVQFHFSEVLREDRRNECIRVRRGWKRHSPVELAHWAT